jgi:hypothetical protein
VLDSALNNHWRTEMDIQASNDPGRKGIPLPMSERSKSPSTCLSKATSIVS